MEVIVSFLQSSLSAIGPLFILLGLLIFVHELGHFMVAKFYGVRVETFSLGFGKKIFQTKKGDTTYCISLIPLGGYVKMFGDDPTREVEISEKKYSFLDKPVSQRIAIVLAGPLMNLFFAGLLFFMIALIGQDVPGPYLGDIKIASQAHKLGFRSGDQILSINGDKISTWKQASDLVKESSGKTLSFVVKTERSEERRTISAPVVSGKGQDILKPDKIVGQIDGFSLESLSTLIGIVDPMGLAAKSGLKTLDYIEKINNQKVIGFRNIEPLLLEALKTDGKVNITVFAFERNEKPITREVSINLSALPESDKDLLTRLGIESAELYLLDLKPDGPAMTGGLMRADKILGIDNQPISDWSQVLNSIKGYSKEGQPIEISYLRGTHTGTAQVIPEMTSLMNAVGQEEQRFTIGIYPGLSQSYPPMVLSRTNNPIEALKIGAIKSVEWTNIIVLGLARMVTGDVSPKNIGSLITIGRYASSSFEAGLSQFLRMMAIISINLFLINLLPVPVLDGGHLVFFSIEALRGAPLSMRKMEMAQQFGLVILISLMAFAFFNDISNLFSAW